jgi:hypothetical protein
MPRPLAEISTTTKSKTIAINGRKGPKIVKNGKKKPQI